MKIEGDVDIKFGGDEVNVSMEIQRKHPIGRQLYKAKSSGGSEHLKPWPQNRLSKQNIRKETGEVE